MAHPDHLLFWLWMRDKSNFFFVKNIMTQEMNENEWNSISIVLSLFTE